MHQISNQLIMFWRLRVDIYFGDSGVVLDNREFSLQTYKVTIGDISMLSLIFQETILDWIKSKWRDTESFVSDFIFAS